MAWTALTTAGACNRKDGKILEFPVAAVNIAKGMLVRINAAGYATSAVPATGDMAAGIALETVTNATGSAGGKKIKVQTEGVVVMNHITAALTIADVGRAALCAASTGDSAHDIAMGAYSAANAVLCGAIVGVYHDPVTNAVDAAYPFRMWVKLQTLQQIKTS